MTAKVETTLRGPQAYGLARRVIDQMERAGVWPTPLNFELWTHALAQPDGALAGEIRRMTDAGEPFTEAVTDALAAQHLPRGRLTDQIRDAGHVLDRELSSVSSVIAEAQRSQAAYGQSLEQAASSIEAAADGEGLQTIVGDLTSATLQVRNETESLEKKLETSTQEVARLRQHLEIVRRDAMTDALTELANRKAFDEHLAAACDKAEGGGAPLTLAVLDIDHFKRFNDTWGHQTGDQVLRYVASVLGRTAANPRFAARFGGEEFAIVFPYESAAMVETALKGVLAEIASRSLRRRSTNDDLGAVTVSAGFAVRQKGETPAALLERADAALYASKRGGRNQVSCAERLAKAA
jgi:diguanylate cyclase